jgi:hypothetical protein
MAKRKELVRVSPILEAYLRLDPSKPDDYRSRIGDFKGRIKFRHGGMTLDDYVEFLNEQNGVCAICGNPPGRVLAAGGRGFHFDHDHTTHELRGLLCFPCNRALGQFGDDPVVLKAALAYLRNPPNKRIGKTFRQTFNRDFEASKGVPTRRQQLRIDSTSTRVP